MPVWAIRISHNMNYQEITEKINAFMIEDFEVEPSAITPEAELKSTLDLDSLDYIDLVVAIEQNFGFKVKPEDFQQMHTIGDFYNYVANRLGVAA
jgi:acyl carrier protein